jgi:DNA-binding MarR family transcriptional regulator
MEAFIMRSFDAMNRYVKAAGLSMPQFSLLMRLYHGGDCEVHDIGQHFDVSSAAASQLVDRLVQAGLVARSERPEDRRVRQVALTRKGRALIDRGIEERNRWVDDLVERLSEKERAAVLRALPSLIEAEQSLPQLERHRPSREEIRTPRDRQ